jgi:hypothetical protein
MAVMMALKLKRRAAPEPRTTLDAGGERLMMK